MIIYTDGFGRTNSVTANNLDSVTSSGVYTKLLAETQRAFTTPYKTGNFIFIRLGNVVYLQSLGDWQNLPAQQDITLFNVPKIFRPRYAVYLREQSYVNIRIAVYPNGNVSVYDYVGYPDVVNGTYNGCWIAAN